MSIEKQLTKSFKEIVAMRKIDTPRLQPRMRARLGPDLLIDGIVTSIIVDDEDTFSPVACGVRDLASGVVGRIRINANRDYSESGFYVVPKVGTRVVVGLLGGGMQGFILQHGEIDSCTLSSAESYLDINVAGISASSEDKREDGSTRRKTTLAMFSGNTAFDNLTEQGTQTGVGTGVAKNGDMKTSSARVPGGTPYTTPGETLTGDDRDIYGREIDDFAEEIRGLFDVVTGNAFTRILGIWLSRLAGRIAGSTTASTRVKTILKGVGEGIRQAPTGAAFNRSAGRYVNMSTQLKLLPDIVEALRRTGTILRFTGIGNALVSPFVRLIPASLQTAKYQALVTQGDADLPEGSVTIKSVLLELVDNIEGLTFPGAEGWTTKANFDRTREMIEDLV